VTVLAAAVPLSMPTLGIDIGIGIGAFGWVAGAT
jgi:hypothetical protein